MSALTQIGPDIWTAEGPAVPFLGFPYTTRMTVIRLSNGEVFLHSPIARRPDVDREVSDIGPVKYLVSPNKIHHLFLQAWKVAHPRARLYASPGLKAKRKDLEFKAELGDTPEPEWAADIDQVIVHGSPAMEEVEFFHKPSKTLIVTDIIQRFPPEHFKGWRRTVMRLWGLTAPMGKAPREWRLSFLFGKKRLREAVDTMIGWQPERIVVSHGLNVEEDAVGYLRKAFDWA